MRKILWAFCLTVTLASCNDTKEKNDNWSENRQTMEERGQELLAKARQALHRRDFDGARQEIEKLRTECDLALTARNQGILLMDSIDMSEALNQMMQAEAECSIHPEKADSLNAVIDELDRKAKFYRRKLEHDKQQK